MTFDRSAVLDLLAEYGALLDLAQYDAWLGLFTETCPIGWCRAKIGTAACRRR